MGSAYRCTVRWYLYWQLWVRQAAAHDERISGMAQNNKEIAIEYCVA